MTLSLQNVQKVYPSGHRAVNGLSLDINEGEFFTLLGPSGCGKTTTLRMIAGLETASSGRICIGGKDFTHTHPRDRDVAMVFQSYALYPHMNVRQNLVLNLEVRRTSPEDIEWRLKEVAGMLGLESLLDRKPGQLSGGQRQRVALGRALIRRPNVFLMDEPLSNLDLKLRERTRTELKKLHERLKVTTVYVTHDQAEALVLSDRIGIMNGGDLLQVGTPQEVYDTPSSVFVAKFVGTPSINFLPVTIDEIDGRLSIRFQAPGLEIAGGPFPVTPEAGQRLKAASGPLILGVRPEAIALMPEPSNGCAEGEIDIVEPMGSVNNIIATLAGVSQMTTDGEPFVAVVRSNEVFVPGGKSWITIRPDRLVLFEQDSGAALAALPVGKIWQ